jgi:hypothetical protein
VKIQILKTAMKRNLKAAMKKKLRPVATMKLKKRAVEKMKVEMKVEMVEMAMVMEEMAMVMEEMADSQNTKAGMITSRKCKVKIYLFIAIKQNVKKNNPVDI